MPSPAPGNPGKNEAGAITAEFAITLPAVLAVLAIVLGGVYLAAERVALVSLAGEVARLEARGDNALAATRIMSESAPPDLVRDNDGRVLCVTATASPKLGLLRGLTVSGRSCAAVTVDPDG